MQPHRPQIAETLTGAIAEAAALMGSDLGAAECYLLEVLKHAPGQPHLLMLIACTKRAQGDLSGARELLEQLEAAEPNLAAIPYECGKLLQEMGDSEGAIASLLRSVELEPRHPYAWQCLGDIYARIGRRQNAAAAYKKHADAMWSELGIVDPGTRSAPEQSPLAEADLLNWIERHPTDVVARRMLGILYMKQGRAEDGEQQFSAAIQLSPKFSSVRWMLARSLFKRHQWEQAISHAQVLLSDSPEDEDYLNLLAECLLRVGDYERAIPLFERLIKQHPAPEHFMYYANALRSAGRRQECIAAYRQAVVLNPAFGAAYWGLANLKSFHFDSSEIEGMRAALEQRDLSRESRTQFHFALGKAYEDAKEYKLSFDHYQKGNAMWRSHLPYDRKGAADWVRRSKAVFTREFLRDRACVGCPAPDPIFIVGLPRSGTTLIEQILASHPMVEGAGELPVLGYVAESIADYKRTLGESYPAILRERRAEDFRAAGEDYIQRTRIHRTLGKPFFTDKMMNNFRHLGLLLLILPNAKIVDARRHPLGVGFANFRQFYPEGQAFTYDLADLGGYYRNYVELMAHFDSVLPGRIHRIFYEHLVTDTEAEVHKLLNYCGLPFEDACLRFYETKRTLLTASSEQVRQPIFAEAMTHWTNYERWLGPMKDTLGDVLECYPGVPLFREPAAPFKIQWGSSSGVSQGLPLKGAPQT